MRHLIATTLLALNHLFATVDYAPDRGGIPVFLDTLLRSAQHITLRVHPDDHVLVTQGAADVLEARGARVLSDASITRGGCVVESDIGVIDASVEARWRRAAASLGCDEGWNGDDDVQYQMGEPTTAPDRIAQAIDHAAEQTLADGDVHDVAGARPGVAAVEAERDPAGLVAELHARHRDGAGGRGRLRTGDRPGHQFAEGCRRLCRSPLHERRGHGAGYNVAWPKLQHHIANLVMPDLIRHPSRRVARCDGSRIKSGMTPS